MCECEGVCNPSFNSKTKARLRLKFDPPCFSLLQLCAGQLSFDVSSHKFCLNNNNNLKKLILRHKSECYLSGRGLTHSDLVWSLAPASHYCFVILAQSFRAPELAAFIASPPPYPSRASYLQNIIILSTLVHPLSLSGTLFIT